MDKVKFENEYEMRASHKILLPYLNTPSGLAQWFADDVTIDEDRIYSFFWDGEVHKARLAGKKTDNFVRFEYLPAGEEGAGKEQALPEHEEAAYVEFSLEKSEITQSVFLRVVDFTDEEDEEELYELWDGMIATLRETVGG
jgi:hypothetical protein